MLKCIFGKKKYFFIPNINEIYIVNILKIKLIDNDDEDKDYKHMRFHLII